MALGLPPPVLQAGDGFTLCELTADDWQLEQELSRNPDVVRWTLYPPDLNETAALDRLKCFTRLSEQGLVRRYAVRVDDRAVGTAGISCRFDPPEVFYALLPEGRGQGAATAATRALSDWALHAGAGSVALTTIIGNAASTGVAERAGFSPGPLELADPRGLSTEMMRWTRQAAN